MKINPISVDYSTTKAGNIKRTNVSAPESVNVGIPAGMSIISFKGGNKGQAVEWCVENKPYFQNGGVATAISDRRCLRVSDADPIINDARRKNIMSEPLNSKAFAMPMYNGSLKYSSESGIMTGVEVPKIPTGLPENSPFKKYEGKYFLTNHPKFHDYVNELEFFEREAGKDLITKKDKLQLNSNIFIMEEVPGAARKIDFGGIEETKVNLFRVYVEKEGKLLPTNDFQVFADDTATWPKPYYKGGYATGKSSLSQTWKGDGEARASKAFVEMLEDLCKDMSKNKDKFDPATIVCNDSQASFAVEYMAEKAATKNEFWQVKKPTIIGHNMADGYIGKTSAMNMFVNIADKELREVVSNDPKYIEALKKGSDDVNKYFDSLIPQVMKDKQGSVSPFKNAVYWTHHGYAPVISSVAEPYVTKLVTDPTFAPAMHEDLKSLYEKGRLVGILNSMEDVGLDPYTKGIGGYYESEYTFPQGYKVNGKEGFKISKMQVYDPKLVNENSVDINHVREVKRLNKISLFERLNKETLENLKALQEVSGHEYDLSTLIAGQPQRKVEVLGYIDNRFLEAAKKPNSDVKLITAWGRGDTQKGMDSVLEAFEKYVLGPGKNDKNTVLVMGGDLKGTAEEDIIKNLIKRLNTNPELEGRFAFLNGFAPNKPLASAADFAVFPSRFAPCELTDLESMKVFCSPIVTNCQGLSQKNFDASFIGEADKVTGYKTKHEYHESLETLRDALPDSSENKKLKTKTDLDKAVQKFRNEIKEKYRITHAGKVMTEEAVNEVILTDATLNYKYNFEVLRPFRDQVIVNDLTDCYTRALITDRNSEIQTQMVKNHLKQYTDWERNGKLNSSGKSSAQLYRDFHFSRDSFAEVKESDTLLYQLREQCKKDGVFERVKKATSNTGNNVVTGTDGEVKPDGEKTAEIKKTWTKIVNFFKSKPGKITAGATAGVAILGGILLAGKKAGWFNKHDSVSKVDNYDYDFDDDDHDLSEIA